ncbi:MAG: extracellular solute-binding protein [Caldilineaceae bacterium]|nr:extracellular solute-binding protein [Caldilineaceae bacterium]
MSLSRRKFLKLSSLTVAGAALAACAPQAAPPAQTSASDAQPEAASPDQAKIEMVYHTWTVPPEGAGEELGTAQFQDANPNIIVEHRQTPFADYWKALLTDAGIGNPPDAYLMNNFNWQEYINAGMGIDLLPAAAILDTPGVNVDEYIPSLLEACKREGKLYGFPKAVNSCVFIANKTLFDEAGVTLPPSDRDWTYADFEEAATAMTDKEKNIFGASIDTGHAWIPTFLFSLGGRYLDPEEHKFAEGYLNTEANAEWVNWIKKMVDAEIHPLPGGLDAFGGADGGMYGGNVAIRHSDGMHQVALAQRSDTPYEFTGARCPIPTADTTLMPHVAMHGVMVPQGVKDVSKAVELAGYAAYGAGTDLDFPSKMSPRKDIAEKEAFELFPHFRPLYDQVFADNVQLHEGALITHVSILGEEWGNMISRVLLEGMTATESLNIAAANYDKRVAEKES